MRRTIFLMAMALVATSAMAANSIAVTGAAALEGSFGLGVTLDPASNLNDTYVSTQHPNGETIYRFGFLVHPGTLTMDASAGFRFFVMGNVRKATPDRNFFFVYMLRTADGWWRVQANARNDNGSFPAWQASVAICGVNPGSVVPCATTPSVHIMYEWKASSASGANDGFLRVYREGVLVRTFSNLDNDTQTVEEAWFGAIFMANGTHNGPTPASGTYNFDSFESYRDLMP